jgi:hypothetical protein
MRTRFLLADVEEDRRDLIRFLEETPLFTVTTEAVNAAWVLSDGGELGAMQVTFTSYELGQLIHSKGGDGQVIHLLPTTFPGKSSRR